MEISSENWRNAWQKKNNEEAKTEEISGEIISKKVFFLFLGKSFFATI